MTSLAPFAQVQSPRLRPLQAMRAVRQLIANPEDTRQVFVVVEAMRGRSGLKMFQRFAASPTGRAILADRRRLLDVLEDQAALARLPEGSLGRAYLAFMQAENLSAAGLVEASEVVDRSAVTADGLVLRERMRDMHDLTHVVTGYGRDPLGELCLLAFMFRHNRNLGTALIALMASAKFPKGLRRRLWAALIEGFRHGGRARWIPELDWEALLDRPLADLRRDLNVPTPTRYLEMNP